MAESGTIKRTLVPIVLSWGLLSYHHTNDTVSITWLAPQARVQILMIYDADIAAARKRYNFIGPLWQMHGLFSISRSYEHGFSGQRRTTHNAHTWGGTLY